MNLLDVSQRKSLEIKHYEKLKLPCTKVVIWRCRAWSQTPLTYTDPAGNAGCGMWCFVNWMNGCGHAETRWSTYGSVTGPERPELQQIIDKCVTAQGKTSAYTATSFEVCLL